MINRRKLRRVKLVSWGYTLMGIFNIAVLFFAASLIAIRFLGPGAFLAAVMPMAAFACGAFFLGEPLVNLTLGAQTPDPEHDERDRRFVASLDRLQRKFRMWIRPRGWVVSLGGMPNAMAYGPGIPGMCAVGISRELVAMLTDDELDGVVGHEFVHIKNRDTGILAVSA